MIRVFAIYPSFDPEMNEMAMVWGRLAASGAVDCSVVARMHDTLKGFDSSESVEEKPHLTIRRYREVRADEGLLAAARSANPDVIFCAVAHNLPAARAVARALGKPIVLHTEFFLDDGYLVRRRYHLGSRLLRRIEANAYRRHLVRSTRLILSSDPGEFREGAPAGYGSLRYLPWPYYGEVDSTGHAGRDNNSSAFIGSMSRVKGAADLAAFWKIALDQIPEFKLTLIGVPVDDAGNAAMEALQSLASTGQVLLRDRIDRDAAIALIRKGLFVFSPGKTFGWGFILDAWRTGTPVIARAEHFALVGGKNCLLAADPIQFVETIRRLQQDQTLWEEIRKGGEETLREHSIENSSARLLNALQDAI